MSKEAKNPVTRPIINPPLPVEAPAPKPDKPLDVEGLYSALSKLHYYEESRAKLRCELVESYKSPHKDLGDSLLKGEEAYFQSLKNKVAALIEGATRIA
jgi:hypothetical protein